MPPRMRTVAEWARRHGDRLLVFVDELKGGACSASDVRAYMRGIGQPGNAENILGYLRQQGEVSWAQDVDLIQLTDAGRLRLTEMRAVKVPVDDVIDPID